MGLEARYSELSALAQFFPIEEKIKWKVYESAFSEDVEVLYVYGFSPRINPLIEWLEEDQKRDLVFLEDRIACLQEIEEEGAATILAHPQVHLKFCIGGGLNDEFIKEVVKEFPYDKIQLISLHDDEEAFKKIKTKVLQKATICSAVHKEMLYGQMIAKNVISNFRRIPDAFDLALWKDRFKGSAAIICGAGPSLEGSFEDLKKMEDKALIFAGGSAISALTSAGICPHLIFAIDPNPEEFTRLALHTAYDVPLIFGSRVERNIFRAHAGPIGYVVTSTGGLLENWMEEKLGLKDCQLEEGLGEDALSVTSIVLMTAIYMGCDPIIFAGVDLSYEDGKQYAPGIDYQTNFNDEYLVDVDGKASNIKWIMERNVFDDVALQHSDRRFIKASAKGLSFKNIPFDPNWALKVNCNRDFRGEIFDAVMSSPLSVSREEVNGAFDQYFESMQKCKAYVAEILSELKSIYPNMEGRETTQRIVILEMDLEEEIAFQISLKQAVVSWSVYIKRDHRPSHLPRNLYLMKMDVYSRLQAIIDEYLKLW